MITIYYSCKHCGLTDRKCIVPSRDSPDDDVAEYMRTVSECIVADHARVTPACPARTITEIKIPVERGRKGWIGKRPKRPKS